MESKSRKSVANAVFLLSLESEFREAVSTAQVPLSFQVGLAAQGCTLLDPPHVSAFLNQASWQEHLSSSSLEL